MKLKRLDLKASSNAQLGVLVEVAPLQSCKNVPTVPTSWCYFFWTVLIFGKYTRKTGENTRKQAKNSAFLVLNFLWEKLVGANFYAFCNYAPLLPAYNVLFAVKELDYSIVGKKIPPSKTTFLKLTSELSPLEREYLYFRIKFRMLAMREILCFCLQILTQIEKC